MNKLKQLIMSFLFNIIFKFDKYKKQYLNYVHNKEIETLKNRLHKVGEKFFLGRDYKFTNPQYMTFGEYFYAENRLTIGAIDYFKNDVFNPKIIIGENVSLMNDIHISCINNIEIGDGCLIASKVFISDHSHGEISKVALKITPNNRPLFSKGPIIIGKNVWIGEGVSILPNVTIGDNCIIGTNSVVNKSIPPNCVAVGVPAKVIKNLN